MNYTKNDRIITVTHGFNFWAGIFVWGWLFSRGLWRQGLLVMLIYIPVYFFHSIVIASLMNGVKIQQWYLLVPSLILAAIHLYTGIKASTWMRTALIRNGYQSIQ
jgi:hypothetical protein